VGVVTDKQDTLDAEIVAEWKAATVQLDGPKEKMATCKTDCQQRGLNHFR